MWAHASGLGPVAFACIAPRMRRCSLEVGAMPALLALAHALPLIDGMHRVTMPCSLVVTFLSIISIEFSSIHVSRTPNHGLADCRYQ